MTYESSVRARTLGVLGAPCDHTVGGPHSLVVLTAGPPRAKRARRPGRLALWLWSQLVIAASLALLTATGCVDSPAEAQSPAAVEAAVRDYNAALVRGFETFDMNELNRVATEAQAEREYFLMAALGEGGIQMRASLVSIEFGNVAFPEEGRAQVTTTETWDYQHVSIDTSETVRTEAGVVYRLQYDLVQRNGNWLVDQVSALTDSYPPDGRY